MRAVEIKLSQGAKPGLGGLLPAAKVTPEIARIRKVADGRDCISSAADTAFHDVTWTSHEPSRAVSPRLATSTGALSALHELQLGPQIAAASRRTRLSLV